MKPLHIVCPNCHTTNRIPDESLRLKPLCGKCKKAIFTGYPLELSATTFGIHTHRNEIPVVVDFWAPWCGPCKMMAPAFGQAAEQLEPHYRLAKLNTEQEQTTAATHNIRSIPTLVIFNKGREVARQSGAMSAAEIVRWVKSIGKT